MTRDQDVVWCFPCSAVPGNCHWTSLWPNPTKQNSCCPVCGLPWERGPCCKRVEHGVFVGSPKAHESGSWLPNIDAISFMCVHVHACMCVCARMSCVWVPTEAKRGHQMPWSWSSCKPPHFCLSTLCLSAYSLQETNSFNCHMRLSQTSALLQLVSNHNSIANTTK